MAAPAELAAAGFAVVVQDCRGPVRVRGRVDLRPRRGGRRVRHRGMGRGAAVVERAGRPVRRLLHGQHPVAGGRGPAAAPGGDGPRVLLGRLLGGVVRARRRASAGPADRLDGVGHRRDGPAVGHRRPAAGPGPGRPAWPCATRWPAATGPASGPRRKTPRRCSTTSTGSGRSATTRCGTTGPPGWTRSSSTRTATTPTGGGSTRPRHYDVLDLPAVHVGGWYDIHLDGILGNFTGMRRQAPTARARAAQRLIVGPVVALDPGGAGGGQRGLRPGGGAGRDGHAPGLVPGLAAGRARAGLGAGPAVRHGRERLARRAGMAAGPDPVHVRGTCSPAAASGRASRATARRPTRSPMTRRIRSRPIGGRLLGTGEFAGPYDQRAIGDRADVLVYTSAAAGRGDGADRAGSGRAVGVDRCAGHGLHRGADRRASRRPRR